MMFPSSFVPSSPFRHVLVYLSALPRADIKTHELMNVGVLEVNLLGPARAGAGTGPAAMTDGEAAREGSTAAGAATSAPASAAPQRACYVALRCMTQVNKAVAGGELVRTIFSPL